MWKPARWTGALPGLASLSGRCSCAGGHSRIVGKRASAAAAECPEALCNASAKLIADAWVQTATLEWAARTQSPSDASGHHADPVARFAAPAGHALGATAQRHEPTASGAERQVGDCSCAPERPPGSPSMAAEAPGNVARTGQITAKEMRKEETRVTPRHRRREDPPRLRVLLRRAHGGGIVGRRTRRQGLCGPLRRARRSLGASPRDLREWGGRRRARAHVAVQIASAWGPSGRMAQRGARPREVTRDVGPRRRPARYRAQHPLARHLPSPASTTSSAFLLHGAERGLPGGVAALRTSTTASEACWR